MNKTLIKYLLAGAAILGASLLVGCASPAPNYAPSIANVEAMKKALGTATAKNGTITVAPGLPGSESISLRANSMVSPVGKHFGDYISAALRQELELAKLFNAQANTEISGVLLKNNINAGGFSVNDGQIEVRFLVKRDGVVRFDKIKRVEHQWESSFVGAIAIPAAANNYPVMVQKLMSSLVSDADFVTAVRP
jgi:hypothetical protein